MEQSRYTRRRQWRGVRHAVAALTVLAAALAVGCGGGSTSEDEKEFDLESLNAGMAQELALVDVYTRGLPVVRGSFRPVWRELRAQAYEYVDGITKSIRGLGGEVDAEPTEVDFSEVKSQADFLTAAYELENAAVDFYVDNSPALHEAAPRILAASLAAGHAQHLVQLRLGLGEDLAAAAPEAFESGELPPPGAETPPGPE